MKRDNFPIGPFEDYSGNPLLEPGQGFQSEGVFNPTVINDETNFYMLYRGESNDGLTGRIGFARSSDGFNFTPHPEPVLNPGDEYDKMGCEDPRIVKFEDTYFMTYVGNSNKYHVSNICLATSKDLLHWTKHGSVLQIGKVGWNSGQLKAGVIVAEKIEGKYVMYFMGEEQPWITAVGIAYSDDLFHWYQPIEEPVLSPRSDYFDCKGVEPGANPVVIEEGILLIYNGWGEDNIYKPGGVIFSRNDPARVMVRTDEPLLNLSQDYGQKYRKANHCVAEGLVNQNKKWLLYYGAADKIICIAIYEKRR